VSPLLIGLTIVGFGTSTPELVTSLQAAFAGSPGISVGNVVGSNIANILLILGVTALIATIPVSRSTFRRDALALIFSGLLCLGVVLSGSLQQWVGLVLIASLFVYLAICILAERSDKAAALSSQPDTPAQSVKSHWILYVGLLVAGFVMTIVGAHYFVRGAIDLAGLLGVPDSIIGLTVVAVGTSLPELVASVAAALRRQTAIALGNIVGSNIYNILFILGATAVVRPIPVPASIAGFDIWVMLAATLALVLIGWFARKITRWSGLAFLGAYIAYTIWLALQVI
jgi:cation:H+ antiporter